MPIYYLKVLFLTIIIVFFFSGDILSNIIYTGEIIYNINGSFHGKMDISMENDLYNEELVFYFHQNQFHKEADLSRIKTHYLYPSKLFTGSFSISNLNINGTPIEADLEFSSNYILIPLPDINDKELHISFQFKNEYPFRIGPLGYHNNILSSIYPPYPLITAFDPLWEKYYIKSGDHIIDLYIPNDMDLILESTMINEKIIYDESPRNLYKLSILDKKFFSFSILPGKIQKYIISMKDLDFTIFLLNENTKALSSFFFLLRDIWLFFTTNTGFKPSGNIIFSPSYLDNNLLLKGMNLVFYDPRLISAGPKFRSLMDYNIIRTLNLALLDAGYNIDDRNMPLISMINEYLSELYYLYCYDDVPQIPRSLFALSIITSVDLNEIYEKIHKHYGLSLTTTRLDQSYGYFFLDYFSDLNLYRIIKNIIGKESLHYHLEHILKKDRRDISIKRKFFDQLQRSGDLVKIEEFLDMESFHVLDSPETDEESEAIRSSIRGRGGLSRYALGFEQSPNVLKLHDDSDTSNYYFHGNSQLLIEPLEPALGYIYKFYISRADIYNSTYGLAIQKDSHLLDGRLLYKILFGTELSNKKRQYEIKFFANYSHYTNARTIEDETNKVYFTGMRFHAANRIDDFNQGYNIYFEYKLSTDGIIGMYNFHSLIFDYDYIRYWTDSFYSRLDFQYSSLMGDKPSFIYNTYSNFCKAVSENNHNIRKKNLIGIGIETGSVLYRHLDIDLFGAFNLRRIDGSIFFELCFLGDNFSEFGKNYAMDIGFRLYTLTEFQNLVPVLFTLDIAFPADSLALSSLYIRIRIRDIF